VPVVTVLVDTPERTQEWFEIVSQLTADSGLVTSENVPAFRATGPGLVDGSLELS
jgi:PII-like signaling protein